MAESKQDFFKRYVKRDRRPRLRDARADDPSRLRGRLSRSRASDSAASRRSARSSRTIPVACLPRDADDPNTKVLGDEERWAISPGYTVLPLSGPERFTTVTRVAVSRRHALVGRLDPDRQGREDRARRDLLRARVRAARVAQGHGRDRPARLSPMASMTFDAREFFVRLVAAHERRATWRPCRAMLHPDFVG